MRSRLCRALAGSLCVVGLALATVPPAVASLSGVVISEFRFRGPVGGSDEFVELLNTSDATVDVSGWRFEGCSQTGALSTRATAPASTTLSPGQHYLFTNSSTSGGPYSGSVPGDQTYSVGIADTGGARITLGDGTLVDAVGSSASAEVCREGAGLSLPTGNADNSFERLDSGRQDTDSNTADFAGPKPGDPQNSGPGEPPPPTLVEIHEIQGAGHVSPLAGQIVQTTGIVVAVRSNGIYVQDPTPDADDATSEGVFVFSATATVGDAVTVEGRATEFRPGGTATNLTTTELTSPTVTVTSSGNPLPPATVVGRGGRVPPATVIDDDATGDVETSGSFDAALDGIDFYESLEGMLVQLSNAVAVGPTNEFGEIPIVVDKGSGAGVRTARGGLVIRPEDFNPERIFLDDVIVATPMVNVDDGLGTLTAVVDYSFGNFKFLPIAPPTVTARGLARETTKRAGCRELAVATFNVENLDPADPPTKFTELASLIVNSLRAPDLIALEEVQDSNGAANDATTDASLTLQT